MFLILQAKIAFWHTARKKARRYKSAISKNQLPREQSRKRNAIGRILSIRKQLTRESFLQRLVLSFKKVKQAVLSDAPVIVVADEKSNFWCGSRGWELASEVKEECEAKKRQQLIHGDQKAIRSQEWLAEITHRQNLSIEKVIHEK